MCGDGGVCVDDADYIFIRLTNGFCKCKKIMTNDVKSGTTQTHFIIHCCCLLQSFSETFYYKATNQISEIMICYLSRINDPL